MGYDEAEFGQTHDPGTILWQRPKSNENTAGSQFYLVDSDGAVLLPTRWTIYTAFGKAYRGEIDGSSTSGVEVIDAILRYRWTIAI